MPMRSIRFALCTALAVPGTAMAQTAPATLAPCATPEYRAFDFWVGEWDVFANGSTTQVATSSIEKIKGSGGGSFSHYDSERHYWRQAWVDGSGARVDFDGGPADGRMILTGHWANVVAKGQDGLIRMTYSKEPDGAVRQHGEQSLDHGLSWTTSFDFIYKPRKTGDN
jgi:hypothetical protein